MDELLNEFNKRIADNDYLGAAAYLKTIKFSDKTTQDAINQQIAVLERYGGITNAILSKEVDKDRKFQIAFALNRHSNNFGAKDPSTGRYVNTYANQFIDCLNNLGNSKDKTATYIDVEFDNQESYNTFVDKSGLSFSAKVEENQLSPYMYTNNGNPVIRVQKQTLQDSNFFDNFMGGLVGSTETYYSPGYWMGQGQPVKINHYGIKSYDADNNIINSWSGLGNELQQAYNLTRMSADTFDTVMKTAYKNVIPTELMASGFMCDAQRQITMAAMSGRIDDTRANSMLKRIDDFYTNKLKTISLTGYDVYATEVNGETANLLEVEDTATKQKYTKWMRAAAKEGRLTAVAGVSGGRVGTILTLSATVDKDNNLNDEAHGDIQLFVPGLLDKDARELMDQDVNSKILVERAEHIAFGHEYKLAQGGRLINFMGDGGAIYKDDLGEVYKKPDEVTQMMLENEMLAGTIKELQTQVEANNYDAAQAESLATDYATKIYDYIYGKTPTQEEGETEPSIKHDSIDEARIQDIVRLMIEQIKQL